MIENSEFVRGGVVFWKGHFYIRNVTLNRYLRHDFELTDQPETRWHFEQSSHESGNMIAMTAGTIIVCDEGCIMADEEDPSRTILSKMNPVS